MEPEPSTKPPVLGGTTGVLPLWFSLLIAANLGIFRSIDMRHVKHRRLGSKRPARFGITAAGNVRFLPVDDVPNHATIPDKASVAAQKPHLFGTYTVIKGADVFPFMNFFRRHFGT